jgi:hypothetical protein
MTTTSMVNCNPSRLLEVYKYVQKSKNNYNRTKYTVKPSLSPSQFLAGISLKGKFAK